jgi:hypothetical protein
MIWRERPSCDAVDRRLIKFKAEPTDLANMRQNGVRSLDVICHGVRELGPRMVCTECGMVGADVRPNWKERRSGKA